ncbi:MAG: hypothetical protein LBW77_01535, partial [Verrucomicrobiota bacterium]|nr:hypothetical protein [Verrucomicrobiota bacterium]
MKHRMQGWIAAGVAATLAGMAHAVPQVSNVTMTQRQGSRIVDVSYTLAGEPGIVTLGIETNGAALPDAEVTTVSGDVSKV